MADRTPDSRESNEKPRDPLFVGADAAMRRAALVARRRALETTGSYPISKDGKIVYVTTLEGFSEEELAAAEEPDRPTIASSKVTTG